MSQHEQQNARERDPTYGKRLEEISRGKHVPPDEVLKAEHIRCYRIARRCRGLSHEDAEDVAQEYCLKIVAVWLAWDQKRPLLPFLNKLLFRELANHGRRQARATLRGELKSGEFGELGEGSEADFPEPVTFDAGEEGDIVIRREYLAAVKCEINRAILELTIEGATVEEIVLILGLEGNQRVWNGRLRGRQDIRDQMVKV